MTTTSHESWMDSLLTLDVATFNEMPAENAAALIPEFLDEIRRTLDNLPAELAREERANASAGIIATNLWHALLHLRDPRGGSCGE